MEFSGELLKKFFGKNKRDIKGCVSINDLRDKEFSGEKLNAEERFALINYDRYRLKVLNAQKDEEQFHYHYRQLQVIANLGDWREFLKEEYYK